MASNGGGEGEPDFQVAPMIDVLLVLLIFFMSITSAQMLKLDRDINLPVASHGLKSDDQASAGLLNISWDKEKSLAKYKLDNQEINPKQSKEIIGELRRRKGTNEKFRLLIRADQNCQAQFIAQALTWGAAAGIDQIAFAGVNRAD